ncbi:MAG: glycine--tRNA ligase subunit beta [Candidatus Poribacteria bacterium]|nr:glycine--tRNA ligase subunit beta [Candidatus Poribacteria bacterium]
MTLQEIILALEKFWADHGCIIQQPCDIEVGAGTFNSATFLRCLGPEPWRVAYVEPVRRPTDGRYAENPFRVGAYYQYQVILKPAPENVLPLYLESLYSLGISPRKNDIRFVEDDWESPTLGASGLGWEVWWNGAEVTQFTYFQQMGSIDLDPICAEITYGLERIALYLQDVDDFFDIRWNEHVNYGDVHRQSEVEYSTYNFERADVDMLFELFSTYEKETHACLDAGLVLPATDHVLKCSHTFNMLDARGVISVTERVSYIERVRRLAQRIARAYVKQREEMEHPLMGRFHIETPPTAVGAVSNEGSHPLLGRDTESAPTAVGAVSNRTETADLLFEIGTEEIPASYVPPVLEQLREIATESLTNHRIPFGEVQTLGTPRRITLSIKDVRTLQESQETEVVGPPKRIAYDENGEPTKAAIGFAKTQGVDLTALRIVETERGEYVAASKLETGGPTRDILKTLLTEWIEALRFPKTMRWETDAEEPRAFARFARPIRWLVALLGDAVIDCPYGAAHAGRLTYGHRALHPEPITLTSADLDTYIEKLRAVDVIACPKERRDTIEKQVRDVFEGEGCLPKLDEELLDTVNYLVENPQPIVGNFSESHLEIPSEVLITAMKTHQRYFPMWRSESVLAPKFVTISNGTDGNIDGVRHGNERVLHARLNDAEFFYNEDQKTSLADKVERLDAVVFHAKLGSLWDKADRLKALVQFIGAELQVPETTVGHAERAAWLCKADLTTQMVIEFPSLQGITGRYYAENGGEAEPVTTAIAEHYQPLGADTPLPETEVGALVAIADKLDTIVGYFGIDERPTGSQDPYSLRRHALGTIRILRDRKLLLSLDTVVEKAISLYTVELAEDTRTSVLNFIKERLRVILLETHRYAPDLADAVLAIGTVDIIDILERASALAEFRLTPNFEEVYNALNRVLRILPPDAPETVDAALLQDAAEKQLYACITDAELFLAQFTSQNLQDRSQQSIRERDYAKLLTQLAALQPAIDTFFDDVLVMAEEPSLRANRLAVLNRIGRNIYAVADLTKLVIAGI